MTIQPNDPAPKFQDPSDTPFRTPEVAEERSDTTRSNDRRPEGRDTAKDKPVARQDRPDSDSAARDDQAAAVKKKASQDEAPTAEKTPAPQDQDQDQAPVAARTRLLEDQDVSRYREQWRELQAGFVDEPRGSVREADTLVAQMMDALTSQLAERKKALRDHSDATDTEQLRVTLQRYRSLFDQMLQV
jgi:hypothetical protein